MAYHDLDRFIAIGEEDGAALRKLYGRDFATVEDLLAFGIAQHLGKAYDITEERLLEAVKQNGADGDEKAVVEHIYQSVKGFTGSHPQSDDITIMSLRI